MNVIFCTSPFQVLVAREVVRYVKEDFIGIYLKMSDDARQTFYAERMTEFCKEVIVLEGKTVFEDIQHFLKDKEISNLYLASLDNPVALSIFNPSTMSLYTFDDGSTSIVPLNLYTQNLEKGIPYTNFTLREVMSLSNKHYTVFD
ncbi:glycosyltransferase family 52, partial [Streptococcus vestibularis]